MTRPLTVPVLLVDDEPRGLAAMAEVLEREPGLHIVTAASGEAALRRLLDEDFAVVLLDVKMPGLDGFQTAELIRQRDRTRTTPILFLTGWHADGARVRGYAIGAVDYLIKPVDPTMLRSKVAVFADLFRTGLMLHRKNLELALARDAAERANRFKSQFLARVSHELRTPLNAIIGYAELIGDAPDRATLDDDIGRILVSGRRLLALVDDVLDLSRIEDGKMELCYDWTRVGDLADVVVDAMSNAARDAGVEVRAEVETDFPDLWVDPLRMRQALFNLLSGTIELSRSGSTATLRAFTEPGRACFAVDDRSIEACLDDIGEVLGEFGHVRDGAGERVVGTGLGLSLARQIVEMHGGTIAIAPGPRFGAAFTVRIPTRRTDPTAARAK